LKTEKMRQTTTNEKMGQRNFASFFASILDCQTQFE
jgi:hypothetical protein